MAISVAATEARKFQSFNDITSFIWSVADLPRGDYKQWHENAD